MFTNFKKIFFGSNLYFAENFETWKNVENVSDTQKNVEENPELQNLSPEDREKYEEYAKQLEWAKAWEKINAKAFDMLKNALQNDAEAKTDPEAKPTIELAQRTHSRYEESHKEAKDLQEKMNALLENGSSSSEA